MAIDLFDRLAQEHRRIAGVCEALARFTPRLVGGSLAEIHEVLRFVTFLSGYGEGYHHELEERVLFPLLVEFEILPEQGPLAHLRDQHVEEERVLSTFESAVAAKLPWGSEQRAAIEAAARSLVAFEKAHMLKENELLFPKAKQELLPSHTEAVQRALERFEARRAPRWNAAWLARLGDELIADHGA
jgi:hemerythrin-like domain-containing protein